MTITMIPGHFKIALLAEKLVPLFYLPTRFLIQAHVACPKGIKKASKEVTSFGISLLQKLA